MINTLINRANFINKNISFIISKYIREYDMKMSNISILRYKGVIDNNEFNYIASLPKEQRQVYVGRKYLQNNNENNEKLQAGLAEMRNRFLIDNALSESDILSIKNDAIFVISKIPTYIEFNGVRFVQKNIYTSYYDLNGVECYYFNSPINERLDIKGISKDKLLLHEEFFLDMLKDLFHHAEMDRMANVVNELSKIYVDYITGQLDTEYYREFNNVSRFKLIAFGQRFEADFITNTYGIDIDGGYNRNILQLLLSYYSMSLNR